MGIGAPELIIVLVVVLLLFGTTRLPKLARSLGQASKEFKQGVSDSRDDGDLTRTEPEAVEAIEAKDTKRPASPSSN